MKTWQKTERSVSVGYIRLRKAGPSMKEQAAKLAAAGCPVSGIDARVYIDEQSRRKQKPEDEPLPERARAIRCCREGDRLVIDSAATLGVSTEDILRAVGQVGKRGAVVFDATAEELLEVSDVALAIEFAHRGGTELRKERGRQMRRKAVERGAFGAAEVRWDEKQLAKAKSLWMNALLTAKEVQEKTGIPARTLYNKFGPRGTPRFGGPKK